MKLHTIDFDAIAYTKKPYDPALRESLLRMGIGFPLHMRKLTNDRYECIDGHKRLSVIHDILLEQPNHKLSNVLIICLDEARTPSGTAKNHH